MTDESDNFCNDIEIYNISGQLMTILVEDYFTQGNHYLTLNSTNFSSGKYFVKMESNNYKKSQIITLVK